MADDGTCESCPIGAECAEGTTLSTLAIVKDYYRLALSSTQVYECGTGNCIGGVGNATCREGSGGVLCAVCDDGYYLKSPSEEEGGGDHDDADAGDGHDDSVEGGNSTTNGGGTHDDAADENINAKSLPTWEECDYSLLTN